MYISFSSSPSFSVASAPFKPFALSYTSPAAVAIGPVVGFPADKPGQETNKGCSF